jgi:hypothetical protein
MSAGDLQNLTVVQARFTARVDGSKREINVKDPTKGRYLVLRLRADKGDGEDRIWAHDFVLSYTHPANGEEDRAVIKGIGAASSRDDVGIEEFQLGEEPYVTVKGSDVEFGLVAYVEPDVTDVALCRVGAAPLPYHIGTERLFSVWVTSNTDPDRGAKVADDLRAAGYHVDAVTLLKEDAVGVKVIYAKGRETEGHAVADRLAAFLAVTPTVVEREDSVMAEYDVLVWLGK